MRGDSPGVYRRPHPPRKADALWWEGLRGSVTGGHGGGCGTQGWFRARSVEPGLLSEDAFACFPPNEHHLGAWPRW